MSSGGVLESQGTLEKTTITSSALNEYDLSNFKVTFSIENNEP